MQHTKKHLKGTARLSLLEALTAVSNGDPDSEGKLIELLDPRDENGNRVEGGEFIHISKLMQQNFLGGVAITEEALETIHTDIQMQLILRLRDGGSTDWGDTSRWLRTALGWQFSQYAANSQSPADELNEGETARLQAKGSVHAATDCFEEPVLNSIEVERHLGKLSPRAREILECRFREGMSLAETAEHMGLGPNSREAIRMTQGAALHRLSRLDRLYEESCDILRRRGRSL